MTNEEEALCSASACVDRYFSLRYACYALKPTGEKEKVLVEGDASWCDEDGERGLGRGVQKRHCIF